MSETSETEFDVNGLLARELDTVYAALLGDADNPALYERLDAYERAYRAALLPSWSVWWATVEAVPPPNRLPKFKDFDRRSNVNALRRRITAAKRTLDRARKGPPSQRIAAEVALQAAEDALQIYRQWPTMLSPADLQRAVGDA